MATSTEPVIDEEVLVERAPVVGACLAALTASTVGAVGLATGNATGAELRLPMYSLAGAVAFVGTLLAMTHSRHDSRTVMRRAVLAGIGGFAVASLGIEGVVYALTVTASQVSLYLLSGVLVACGVGYWSLRSWRDVNDLTQSW